MYFQFVIRRSKHVAVHDYRPVSLPSVVVKFLERLIHSHVFFQIVSYYVIINMASENIADINPA